jgi:hypothetical protein
MGTSNSIVVGLDKTKPCLLLRSRFEESFGGYFGFNLPLRPSVSANHIRTIAIGSAPRQPPSVSNLVFIFGRFTPFKFRAPAPITMCLFQFLVGPKTRKGRVVTSFSRSIVLLSIPSSFHALNWSSFGVYQEAFADV